MHALQAALGDAFRIERELSGGGMSRLFVALEASLNRRVVIKLLPPELASEVSAARFKQEMEFAAGLQHPHILPVLAAGVRGDLLYFIMPFVEGESLRARLARDGRLPIADAHRLLREIADALAYAHAHGIIHRDIKPDNILLEGQHAVLADFGIARAILESRDGGRLTGSGTSIGTPGYMAPEQLAGETVDARADVYALAVVGYEMLVGRPPFSALTAQALLAATLTEPPAPVAGLRPDTPAALSDAIAKALAKRPGDRFVTAVEFAEAISTARVAENVATHANRRARRRFGIAAAAAAAALLLSGALLQRAREARAVQALLAPVVDDGDLDAVAVLLDSLGLDAASAQLGDLRERLSGRLGVVTEEEGVEVRAYRISYPAAVSAEPFALRAGAALPVVAGEYLVETMRAPRDTIRIVVRVVPAASMVLKVRFAPPDAGDVVLVSGVTDAARSFRIGRCEVTNAEYLAFVRGGGYADTTLWPATLRIGGRTLDRESALQALVDRTGLAAPRDWANGRHSDGAERHPVTGITWYEASAYARWAGGALPTYPEWRRAALGDGGQPFPWGTDGIAADLRANFSSTGTVPCGTFPAGASPSGALDMAGNVREWLADADSGGTRPVVAGGGWQDPSYVFTYPRGQSAEPGTSDGVTGFRIVRPTPE